MEYFCKVPHLRNYIGNFADIIILCNWQVYSSNGICISITLCSYLQWILAYYLDNPVNYEFTSVTWIDKRNYVADFDIVKWNILLHQNYVIYPKGRGHRTA